MSELTFDQCNKIIEKYHQQGVPVDVLGIAKEMGLKVFAVKDWGQNLSGMIKLVGDEYHIYVNADHVETRQRFTIAHEIAHFVLHRPQIGNGIVDDALYRSGQTNFVEAEANSFAADILMPRKAVDVEWRNPDSTLQSMASDFRVSEQAMAIRLGVPN